MSGKGLVSQPTAPTPDAEMQEGPAGTFLPAILMHFYAGQLCIFTLVLTLAQTTRFLRATSAYFCRTQAK
jgi:hypothetical protein